MGTCITDLKSGVCSFSVYKQKMAGGYGLLYNGFATANPLLAPTGWHVSSVSDWYYSFQPYTTAGKRIKEIGTSHWFQFGGTDIYGFKALPGGERNSYGQFDSLTIESFFRTNDINDSKAYFETGYLKDSLYQGIVVNNTGMSVRLVKNDNVNPGTVTDYDGNVYNCISVNGYVWTVQNLKVTHFSDGTLIPKVTDGNEWSYMTDAACCAYNNDDSLV
jgi:uncharacterized protein (TIGR02145 family)